jgi:hypothetical protein
MGKKVGRISSGLVLLALIGCGTASVSGTVTCEGRPVTRGKITLVGSGENGTAQGTDILDGKYTMAEVQPGKKRVQILVEELPRQATDGKQVPLPAEGIADPQEPDVARGKQQLDITLKELRSLTVTRK